ncbi:hypothetical protein [Methylosinus sp. Sm6]|uniref:hypothetical protein n=1 Tax=Methylosinus sp. Sm6 TaxID=2866948 RepID=UPI001C99C809|nr:hypothetical protein [Methylosinus sp. Sm6]MBY6242205.1 hypothetical protein [Methylosinus sp. Sm6]
MSRKQYIVVAPGAFPRRAAWEPKAARPLDDILDVGDSVFLMGDNVAFVETTQEIASLTERLREKLFGETMFFLADITSTSRAANMPQQFWSYLEASAAEGPSGRAA